MSLHGNPKRIRSFDAENNIWLMLLILILNRFIIWKMDFYQFKKDGYQVFDFENGLSKKAVQYISNPLNYRTEEGLLFLYLGNKMFRMNEDKSIQLVELSEYGSIYLDRYSFRGKDLEYFISFYNNWKDREGSNPGAIHGSLRDH